MSRHPAARTRLLRQLLRCPAGKYDSEEEQQHRHTRHLDHIGVCLLLALYAATLHSLSSGAELPVLEPPRLVVAAQLAVGLLAVFNLYVEIYSLPRGTKEAEDDFLVTYGPFGRWVYLTHQTIGALAVHALASAVLPSLSRRLAYGNYRLSPVIGACGVFVTIQYFNLVKRHPEHEKVCQLWAARGVRFGVLDALRHVLPMGVSVLDILFKHRDTLLEAMPSPSGLVRLHLLYVIVFLVGIHLNHHLTGRWPYGFMKHVPGCRFQSWPELTMPSKRILKRWQSEATRRRRAALAKYRQGLNGKWESNAKKALAKRVKQKSLRIGPLLARCKAAQDASLERNLAKAQKLVKVLQEADQDVLSQLVPQLESLPVTAALLRRTLIPKFLRETACKFPSIKSKVTPIIQKWREIYVEDRARQIGQKKEAFKRSRKGTPATSQSRPDLPLEPEPTQPTEPVNTRQQKAPMRQMHILVGLFGNRGILSMPHRSALAGVFHGMEHPGPSLNQALRAPRLQEELQTAQALCLDLDDFRQLQPVWVKGRMEESGHEDAEKRSLIATAIFLGTAQACLKGCYITATAQKVECGHLVRPISCVHPPTSMPSASLLKASGQMQQISGARCCDPLDVALQLAKLPHCRRVAVLRCTPFEAPRSLQRKYSHIYEDQVFLRTTYFEAFERLARDLPLPPDEAIKEGCVVYTSGVGVLRGPLKDGVPWLEQPPQVDVVWFGLPAHPEIGEQETYAREEDGKLVKAALDRAFSWACAHGADAIVMPAMSGLGSFRHPRLHFGGLVHEVARMHQRHLPIVCVASDAPAHRGEWWPPFEEAVTKGRPVPPPLVHVPPIPLMNDRLVGKDGSTLLEKRRKQLGVWSIHGRRLIRFTNLHKSLSAAATNSEARLNFAESGRASTRLNVDMQSMTKLLRRLLVLAAVSHHVDAITFKTAARAPVQKVRELLQAMRQEMAEDAERDEAVHEKQACWCNSNIYAKQSAVSTNQNQIAALTSSNNRLTADTARWTSESEQMTKDISDAEADMVSAKELRQGQQQAFEKEEARLVGLVSEIDEAFKQVESDNEAAGSLLAKYQKAFRTKMDTDVGSSPYLKTFLNMNLSTGRSFLQREPLKAEGVEAVLNGIKNDTTATLTAARGQETRRIQSHTKLLQDKATQVKALEQQKQDRRKATADAAETKASNKDIIANLEVQIAEDSAFLADVKSRCQVMDQEWAQRQRTRAEEVEAIAKAMEILKEEAVKEALLQEPTKQSASFWGHFNAGSFLQEQAVSHERRKLSEALLKVGQRHDLRLVTLAFRAKIDNFATVKKAIENMTIALEKEQQNEVKHRKYCADQLDDNEVDAKEKNDAKQQQSADEMGLQAEIAATTNEAAILQSEVDELLAQAQLASQNREKENGEFQSLTLEQREKKRALEQALAVLKDTYSSEGASMFQLDQSESPAGFGAYQRASGGKSVLTTIQQVIADTETLSAEAAQAEAAAQQNYEAFAAETADAVKLKREGIRKLNDKHAKQEVQLAETAEAKRLTVVEIAQLLEAKEQLHESCDFLLSQFEVSQKARAEELQALERARDVLSGALTG
ncbi:unnamed protein product [Symbiodinium microadriaticum]|nr:unnamed protein product [Symbiodinium microadriaticum]